MLITKYDELGLRASGKYEKALEAIVTKSSMIMYGANHSYFMEKGRGTGPDDYRKAAPFAKEWIENKKGLPAVFYEKKESIAFAIAHKWANEGIQVPNKYNKGKVVSDVVDDFVKVHIPEMLKELGLVFLSSIQSDLANIYKDELTAA